MEDMNVLFKVIRGTGCETPKGEVDGQDLALRYYLSLSLLCFLLSLFSLLSSFSLLSQLIQGLR